MDTALKLSQSFVQIVAGVLVSGRIQFRARRERSLLQFATQHVHRFAEEAIVPDIPGLQFDERQHPVFGVCRQT